MLWKRPFQIFVLLTLLFSPFGLTRLRASASSIDQSGAFQTQPTVSISVSPASINVGGTATVTVRLDNVPVEGYTSLELTCSYYPNLVEASDILVADLFGTDPAVAIKGPQYDRFIVAIAGNHGYKATSGGTVMTFAVRGLQAGQSPMECQGRASQGDNTLTEIASTGDNVMILDPTPTPTTAPSICDQAQFVADINFPDGTPFAPGASFIKTWRFKNIGSCTWTTSYRVVFFSGEQMGAPSVSPLPVNVAPGAMVDISLPLTAPSVAGSYRGYWMFQNTNGTLFGIGPQANRPWWLEIKVTDSSPTPGGPTLTPSPTATPTIKPSACDKAELIDDVTVPPGTVIAPGAQFTKVWRLKNVGSCTWTASYRIALLSGEQMGAPSSAQFTQSVVPGQTVDISLTMTAPATAGLYRGYWIFQNETGGLFGVGPLGNEPWFVDIVVSNNALTPSPTATQTSGTPTVSPTPSSTPGGPVVTPIPGVVYDFVANMCSATWFSGAGGLPCPGIEGDPKGFVFKVDQPRLENGVTDPRPGLLTFPQNVQNGYIQGFYPPFHVQTGDRFRSTLSCESGATNCYLAFRLDYQTGADPIRTLFGPFLERYDGHYYTADIDLSSLAGKDVKFILTILSAGYPEGDRALWVGPVITRTNVASATSTPVTEIPSTLTPEASPTQTPTPTVEGGGLTSTALPGTGTPMPAVGLLNGKVFASKPVRIEAYDAENNLVGAGLTNPDGSYEFYAPSGTHSVVAMAGGFLSAQRSVTITEGNTTTLPTLTLIAGDIDGNQVIDQFDALTIGMNYNKAVPSEADMNNDGIINVLDLELLASHYRKTGPVPWE